jgi:hypothetical protein
MKVFLHLETQVCVGRGIPRTNDSHNSLFKRYMKSKASRKAGFIYFFRLKGGVHPLILIQFDLWA